MGRVGGAEGNSLKMSVWASDKAWQMCSRMTEARRELVISAVSAAGVPSSADTNSKANNFSPLPVSRCSAFCAFLLQFLCFQFTFLAVQTEKALYNICRQFL